MAGETSEMMLQFISTQFVHEKPHIYRIRIVVYLWENIRTVGSFPITGSNLSNEPTPIQEFRAVSDNNILVLNTSICYIEEEIP